MVESRPHQTQIESHWQGSGDNIEFRGTIKYFGGYFYSYFQDLVNIIEFKGIVKYPFYSSICRVLALLQQMRGSVLTGWEPRVKILIMICFKNTNDVSKYKWLYVSKYFLIIQYWHSVLMCNYVSNGILWYFKFYVIFGNIFKNAEQVSEYI